MCSSRKKIPDDETKGCELDSVGIKEPVFTPEFLELSDKRSLLYPI